MLGLVREPHERVFLVPAREHGLPDVGYDERLQQPPHAAGNVLPETIDEHDLRFVLEPSEVRRRVPGES
ncbi:MAG: hypothetical protein ABSE79_13525 [Terriglobia bacterium]|jgi:hypothetical protein